MRKANCGMMLPGLSKRGTWKKLKNEVHPFATSRNAAVPVWALSLGGFGVRTSTLDGLRPPRSDRQSKSVCV